MDDIKKKLDDLSKKQGALKKQQDVQNGRLDKQETLLSGIQKQQDEQAGRLDKQESILGSVQKNVTQLLNSNKARSIVIFNFPGQRDNRKALITAVAGYIQKEFNVSASSIQSINPWSNKQATPPISVIFVTKEDREVVAQHAWKNRFSLVPVRIERDLTKEVREKRKMEHEKSALENLKKKYDPEKKNECAKMDEKKSK